MTRDEWAAKLNGCECGEEIDRNAPSRASGILRRIL